MEKEQIGRIDGFLEAIASLKDDGTGFIFDFLGKGYEDDLPQLFDKYFSINVSPITVKAVKNWATEVLPELKHWILTRIRIVNDGDTKTIDQRLFDRFIEELLDSLSNPVQWYVLNHTSNGNRIITTNEAMWHCFTIATPDGCYLLHCGWNS